ncbi:armadillo-type protein [Gymnopilus junonius]|uniref:U3 small nucleolar RNA-associated protein 10 n=1 Tax=Gymnopilus junonius TaxID=109634 RepID=A0A9P5NPA7_GYMJU|nr:armadillo-type protein [Gymnopilus junonius]
MSSLATQLAQSASLNASLLVDRSRRKPTTSYLFTGRDADLHDLEAIHAIGVNSLIHLSSVSPTLEKYEDALFSERAKDTDRTLLTAEANEELDRNIEEFLWLLGPYLMEPPTGKILEWLVRRFRINEFNIEAVLSLFLPYHESPHFAKMITILQIKPNSTWSFLIPYKSAAQNLRRVSLVTEMLKNTDLTRFVTSLLPVAIKKGLGHRVLLAFNAATLHEFIKRSKSLDEGTMAFLLPALLKPLQQKPKKLVKDAVLGSYILLASLSQKCDFAPAALRAIVAAMASSAHVARADQFMKSLIAVCEAQDELDEFTDGTLKALLRMPTLKDELASGSAWLGSERVLSPIVKGLCNDLNDSASSTLLEHIIATNTIPPSVIEVLTFTLISAGIKPEEPQTSLTARRLLFLIKQRYPDILQKGVERFEEEEDDLKDAIEQLVMSLSTLGQISASSSIQEDYDMILASTDADAKVRTNAIKDLVKSISGKALSDIKDLNTVRSLLIARLQDTHTQVLEALYENASVVTPVLASDPKGFLASLSSAMDAQSKPKRNILRLHLSYVACHFWPAVDSTTRDDVFQQLFFPFLLFSKPRQKTAGLLWDALKEHLSQSDSIEWLTGCFELVKPEVAIDGSGSIDLMNQINFSVAGKIAENVVNSSCPDETMDTVLTKLHESRLHVKLMGYLVTLAIIRKLSGECQIAFAQKVLAIIALNELSGIDDHSQEHLALGSSQDISLGKYVVTKPNSKTTLNWLQILAVAAISQISRPPGTNLDWLADPKAAHPYVSLARSIYQLANASTSVPVLSTTILQILFATLNGDALAFLAGIWTIDNTYNFKDSRSISLLHAAAFLEAHILEDDGVDFQTILPALLVALQSPDPQISLGALECISRVRILADRKLSSVYKFDVIYGENDRTLEYLDQGDLKKYLNGLVEHRDHFTNDPSYLKVFHEQHLVRSKSDKKRDADYKHGVLCYLLSHINALSSETIQVSLLKSTAPISNKAKIQILLPTVHAMIKKVSSIQPTDTFSSVSEEFATRLLSCYDSSAAGYLNETAQAWDDLLQGIRTFFRSGTPLPAQDALVHTIESGLFTSLNQKRKYILSEVLIEVGSQDSTNQSLARRVLSAILEDVPLIIHLLDLYTPVGPTSSPRAKRVKTTEPTDDILPRLGLLVEILGSKSLPGSLDLISHLLDTLSKTVQALSPAQADVSYIQQLLMSALESAASKIIDVPNLSPSVIRLDILVEVIRVSGNPQTFHQALLLIASLARLAPESVLYNVMPVFTFMGSNVFHRDDSYNFKVVQQTIDGIIPVMVSSLKEARSQPLDLYLASREFLRVFSDAANHIPRHRRNNFFSHLVDVLGARDFTAPVSMLLIEKIANRLVRQSPEEAHNSLSLPIAIFQHISYAQQLYTANEVLQESSRIVKHIIDPASIQPIFLEAITDGDHSASSSTILRRRAQALIIFIGHAFRPKGSNINASENDVSISSVISKLITLATLLEGASSETKVEEISDAARLTLNKLISGMSVVDFSESVRSMLQSGNVKVQAGALELLAKRLPDVSTRMRPALSSSVIKALASVKDVLSTRREPQVTINALQAIKSIASTMSPGEEGALSEITPLVLSSSKEKDTARQALGALAALSVKLGPRIIPFFRSIISQSITVLRDHDAALFEDAFAILHGLLSTIPTFWGSSEVNQVVFLYIDQTSATSKPLSLSLSSLAKSLAKRTPSKVLIPTLLDMWQQLTQSNKLAKISAYFDVLGRALQHADRPTVLEHLRSSFKIFLEALNIVKADYNAESRTISAFKELVVKLNETAFKPLFRRLYDWAFVEEPSDTGRKVTFGHLYISLLDFFKGLMVPYMSFLQQQFSDILTSFTTSTAENLDLWSSVIQILTRTLNFDDGGFWRDDKLRQISTPLTAQVEVCVRLNFLDGKSLLQECFGALIENVTDDTLLKTINLNILMHTRSEDSRVRLFALECAQAVWHSKGGKLLGLVGETATFIAECGEDENDLVIKESFKLKEAVESVAGKIDEL